MRKKGSKTHKYFEETQPMPAKFIANSSPIGNDVGKHAHSGASEKGKPVARRGRKA
jgi:hypothetical protein